MDYVKKKIVEKLARFTKNLKPSDITLSFLSGKGHLSNLELDAQFISEALQLPPWVFVSRVVCDTIKARVPFTNLKTDPVNFYIGKVLIEITTSSSQTHPKSNVPSSSSDMSSKLLDKLGGNPSKYGLIEKVIDGMTLEVRSVLVYLKDPSFQAYLEMTDILLQSTSPEWTRVPLSKARIYVDDEDSVINYKLCTWSNLKIEGSSMLSEKLDPHNQLRLIVEGSSIRIAFKRKMSDSSLVCSRISMHLGDLMWILTQSQLRAVSRLVQSLMDAAVHTQQNKREEEEASDSESVDSLDSASSDRISNKSSPNFIHKSASSLKKKKKPKKLRLSNLASASEKLVAERLTQYQEGQKNLPAYEVIQNSFHLKTGKVDLQLCDDTSAAGGSTAYVQGSLLAQVFELVVDVYLDQPACSGHAHWNQANDIMERNMKWSSKLVTKASKTQFVHLPSVHMGCLRERGVVIRCAGFSVGALRSANKATHHHGDTKEASLPILTSDKKTFSIPDDVHNPAFQVGITLYFYADRYGNKFLVPRPNVNVYLSPVHVYVHQESCLWLVEFIYGVLHTINIELALTIKDEGKTFLEERKSQSPQVQKVPGVDLEFKILFTKVTLPVLEAADDGRPKALQIETASIIARNIPLHRILGDSSFEEALVVLRQGWLLKSQDTPQFPHYEHDLQALPKRLQELLQHKMRTGRRRGERDASSDSCSSNGGGVGRNKSAASLTPEVTMSEIEGWHVSTSCVHVAFVSQLTHKATLHTTTFINDFPVHLWLFLPPPSLNVLPHPSSTPHSSDLSPSTPHVYQTTPSTPHTSQPPLSTPPPSQPTPSTPHPSLPTPSTPNHSQPTPSTPNHSQPISSSSHSYATNEDASTKDLRVSFLAHIPTPMHVEIERLQLLFLLRLKDSLTAFKTSLMRFLDPYTFSPELKQTLEAHRHANKDTDSDADLPMQSASISGLVSLSCVEASLLLPSLYSSRPSRATNTDIGTGSSSSCNVTKKEVEQWEEPLPPHAPNAANEINFTCSEAEVEDRCSLSMPGGRSSTCSGTSSNLLLEEQRKSPSSAHLSLSNSFSSVSSLVPTSDLTSATSQSSLPGDTGGDSLQGHTHHKTSEIGSADRLTFIPPAHSLSGHRISSMSEQIDAETVTYPHLHCENKLVKGDLDTSPMDSRTSTFTTNKLNLSSEDESVSSSYTRPQLQITLTSTSQDTLPPVTSPPVPTLSSSTSSLLTPTSACRQKSPTPLRTIPRFVLHTQLRHLCALVNVDSEAITFRLSVETVNVRELTSNEYQGMQEILRKKGTWKATPPGQPPSIKARLEMGKKVQRFFPPDCHNVPDVIMIAIVEGLDLSLLVSNMAIVKDFFDDEYETVKPIPLHVKVAGTRTVMLDDVSHGADHPQSMVVAVDHLEIHRGRELVPEMDIFREYVTRHRCDEGDKGDEGDQLHLQSLAEFRSAFESCLCVSGDGHTPHLPPHKYHILQAHFDQLHSTLQQSALPPPYSVDTIPSSSSYGTARTHMSSLSLSSSSELLRLRREMEGLRQVQRECESLSAQVKDSQIVMGRHMADFMMVTDECKRVKEELVSYKQVMEKQQEHIERLLTENFELRQMLDPLPLP